MTWKKSRRTLAAIAAVSLIVVAPSSVRSQENEQKEKIAQSKIKHVIVIFQENISFDHYFGTYPIAQPNNDGSVFFHGAKDDTPTVNGLFGDALLTNNKNLHNPFRLDRSQAVTCDQDHNYNDEQKAFDMGLMDLFVQTLGTGTVQSPPCLDYGFGKNLTMGYYDGNTVTALWNYAQNFAMSDNSFGTTFGPSTPGALNLISGQTNGVDQAHTTGNISGDVVVATDGSETDTGDGDPFYDDCSGGTTISMTGQNVGNLLSAKGLTWGWFEGGFTPTVKSVAGSKAVCGAQTQMVAPGGTLQADYSPHHQPFQYYLSTSNPHHLPRTSIATIGHDGDQGNHQYDLTDFFDALDNNNLPAVSFLKAKRAQDGHANNSDPIDEQLFLVNTINRLQQSPEWNEMAVIINYDDSDGWYDHQMGPIVKQSNSPQDFLTSTGHCGIAAVPSDQGRCGYGPRLVLMVISPWAKRNFVDHTITDQSSILRFIEDNFGLGRIDGSFDALAGPLWQMFDFDDHKGEGRKLFLDPTTGQPAKHQ